MRRALGVDQRALAVDRHAQGVDDAAQQGVADRHREDASGGAHDLLLLDARRPTPSTTAPMVSSSRFIARPSVPSSNSSSSLTLAEGRPETRAMPSPTSTMRPTCSAPTAGLNSVTCLRSASVISVALMVSSVITVSFCLVVASQGGFEQVARGHGVAQRPEASPRGGVEAQVADLDEDAAQQGRAPRRPAVRRSCR